MQMMEASKKAGIFGKAYLAMVVIAPSDEEQFLTEFSQAAEALHNWKGQRRSSAKEVKFTVVCKEAMNPWVRTTMVSAFEHTPELIAVRDGTQIAVAILNRGETPADEFRV